MPDVSDTGNGSPSAHPHVPATAGLDGLEYRTAAEAAPEVASLAAHRVGWGFIALYTLAYISTSLLFLAPLLVTLALKAIQPGGSRHMRVGARAAIPGIGNVGHCALPYCKSSALRCSSLRQPQRCSQATT